MKKLQLLLLFALAGATSAWAASASFTAASITLGDHTENLPASGMDMVVLEEAMESFVLDGFQTTVSGTAESVKMVGTMYKDGQSPNKWREIPAGNNGGSAWGVGGLNFNILEGEEAGKTFVFEFYFEGSDKTGQSFFYNNGGQNYKVKFTKAGGASDQRVQFTEASLTLTLDNNRTMQYTFPVENTRTPWDHPGELSNLRIDGFSLQVLRESGVNLNDVSVQYKVYQQGSDGNWNGIPYADQQDVGDKYHKLFWNDKAYVEIDTNSLAAGKSYVLEIMFQLVDNDGNYYFFGRDSDAMKFNFSKKAEQQFDQYDVNHDGKVNVSDVSALINRILGII